MATGTFDIYVLNGRKSRQDIIAQEQANGIENATRVKSCKAGDFFGELGLMNDIPRQASIACSSPAVVWSLSKTAYAAIAGDDDDDDDDEEDEEELNA